MTQAQRRSGRIAGLIAAAAIFQACSTGTNSTSQSGATSGSSSSSSSSASGAYSLSDGTTVSTSSTSYSSTTSDVSAIYVTNGTLKLSSPTITKSGDASSSESSSKTGLNAAVLASSSKAAVSITGGTIASDASGGNAVFAYDGATVSLEGVTIKNTGSGNSRSIYAVQGGIVNATDVTATTTGSNSSVVATDTGGGTITLTGGSFAASGTDSAGLYCTGTITGNGITASSGSGEAAVIEGSNSILLTDSSLSSGAGNRGVMILNSGSGDGGSGLNGVFTMKGGSLGTTASTSTNSDNTFSAKVPLFEVVTNMTGTVTLTDVDLSVASGILMEVDYNTRWSSYGATGKLLLKTAASSGGYAVSGDVIADSHSAATVDVGAGVTWKGSFDSGNAANSGVVTVESGGTWVLTGNSYVDSLSNGGTITTGSYTLYVNGTAWSGS
jgi:hypothetical protein